jgi:hypothetical protein
MRVRAKQKIYYDKKDRHPGDTYDMDDREESEAKVLVALGKIEIVAKEAKKPEAAAPPRYIAAAMVPEEEQDSTTTDSVDAGERKRFYRRRDMRVEK